MEAQVYKIGKLTIENEDCYLEIRPVKSKIKSELIISFKNKNWKFKDISILETDNYNIKHRSGIWFEQGDPIFFSRVSLFEETEYYFEIKSKVQVKREIEVKNEIEGNLQTQQDTVKNEQKNLLSNFFESIEKWVTETKSQYREDINKYLIIKKEIINGRLWSINFKAYTGRLKLRKEIIGNDLNDIEVIPKKLSKQNYIEMLDELNFFISQIFFKNKSPTQIPATREYLPSEIMKTKLYDCATYLLLRAIMEEIDIYFYGIMNRLNSKFNYFNELLGIHEIRDVSNIDYIHTISNPNNLLMVEATSSNKVAHFSIGGVFYTFNKIYCYSKKLSFDTPENRFIKFVLKLLFNELEREDIKKYMGEAVKFDEKSEFTNSLTNLTEMIHFLEREDIKDLQIIPYNSQTIQKNSYYRRFFQYFIWLQNPTAFNIDNLFLIDIKPMWRLYEYYCLNIMKKSLDLLTKSEDQLLNFPDNLEDHILCPPDGNFPEYRATKFIQLEYKNRKGEIIQLIYKPKKLNLKNAKNEEILKSYSTKTVQDPDFILVKIKDGKVCSYNGKKNHMVVIDSKYRVESGNLWAKMHFYKDALNAIGTIFINPSVDEKDFEYSGKFLTPYEEITEDKILNNAAVEYGFVTGVNVLGLTESTDPVMGFKKVFKIILEKYFQ